MRNKKIRLTLQIIAVVILVFTIVLAGIYFTGQNSASDNGEDFVAVLDVGQADSILICSNGKSALIDTGDEITASELLRKLYSYGVDSLDAIIISHSHSDHAGALPKVLGSMPVGNVILPEFGADEKITEITNATNKSEAKVYSAVEGMVINIGDFELTVLATDSSEEDINNRSVIVMAAVFGNKFLFSGDAEKETEKDLIDSGINFDCDVLKVGHHGSNTSSTKSFLDIATPEYAAISVGEGNSYGHPSNTVIDRLESMGTEVFRTDYMGDIVFNIVNERIVRPQ